ncbi:hypothetical protein QYM36_019380, partial [Artemia franciscana]
MRPPIAPGLDPHVPPSLKGRSYSRKLYIFAGQRHKEYMNDFFTYHVDTGEIDVIADGTRQDTNQVPAAGFTQRSTIDPYRDEIHVLS